MSALRRPSIVVLSSLFPSTVQPHAGLFIRERMFRVGRQLPMTVVAPIPWFPFQGVIRLWRPGFRPEPTRREIQDGVEILRPRFLSAPGILKVFDGLSMALASLATIRRLKRAGRLDILDAHFGYPDGYAAGLLGRWLRVPVAVTLRGTEARHARTPGLRSLLRVALRRADRVFAVAAALEQIALSLGVEKARVRVVGNGVDTQVFRPISQCEARKRLGIPDRARVLITVGGLVERKGFHRVIECLPELKRRHPDLRYLIVGGASPEGDWSDRLREQVAAQGLTQCVQFLGALAPADLSVPLSAADLFVLATRNEGWANVLLEAMACGLPVVTTDVGGNAEVVCSRALGVLVPFGDREALTAAIAGALDRQWDRDAIVSHARENAWDSRVEVLVEEFHRLASRTACLAAAAERPGRA